MEIKGTAVMATREFVKSKYGPEGLDKFMAALPPESAKIFSGAILTNQWYDLTYGLVEPTRAIARIFYGGDTRAYTEVGKHSAEHGLRGIYRLFIKVASPTFILGKAGSILPTYYNPSAMRGEIVDRNKFNVFITQFEQYSDVIEHRVAGWIEAALSICGCVNVRVNVVRSLLKKDGITQYEIVWDN